MLDQDQLFEKLKEAVREEIARADPQGQLAAVLAAWEAGLARQVPRSFACYAAKERILDPDWFEYLRLREKFEAW